VTSPEGVSRLDADLAQATERAFMDRLVARLMAARRFPRAGRGDSVAGSVRRDGGFPRDYAERVRRILRAEGRHDPVLWARLPKGARARFEVRGGSLLFRRTLLVLAVAAVHPFRELALGLSPVPLDPEAAAGWLPAVEDEEPERLGVVLSSSGWRTGGETPDWEGAPLVLFEPAPGGGFKPAFGEPEALPDCLRLESDEELASRVLEYVRAARVELVLHGLSARRTADAAGVPEALVRAAFERAAREDEFLWLSEEDDEIVLRRS
jgi:hypothetical protein